MHALEHPLSFQELEASATHTEASTEHPKKYERQRGQVAEWNKERTRAKLKRALLKDMGDAVAE